MMIMCFNALNGLLPFLLDSFAHDFHLSILKFQRPKRASSISTQFLHMVTLLLRKSFNALNGLLPFLQDDTSKKAKLVYNGFNALNGLLPFLRRHVPVDSDFLVNRFQRPKRASSISTATSGNPHKHWLSRLVFAGICLNILKTAVFWKFFGMFTLCSYFSSIFCLSLDLFFLLYAETEAPIFQLFLSEP